MTSQAKTFPRNITSLGRGRGQKAVLDYLHRTSTGTNAVVVTDMAAYRSFRGMHFGAILSAIDALAKRGIVRKSHDGLGTPTIALVPHTHE